jgi:hypothetical protein
MILLAVVHGDEQMARVCPEATVPPAKSGGSKRSSGAHHELPACNSAALTRVRHAVDFTASISCRASGTSALSG